MGVFGMLLAMSQMDFVMIRLSGDLIVNVYTNLKFMRNKEHNPGKYYDLERNDVEMNLYRRDAPSDISQLITTDKTLSCFSIDDEPRVSSSQ